MLKLLEGLPDNVPGVSAEGKITAKFFGHMLSCELRIFKNAELEEAKKRISENQ